MDSKETLVALPSPDKCFYEVDKSSGQWLITSVCTACFVRFIVGFSRTAISAVTMNATLLRPVFRSAHVPSQPNPAAEVSLPR
jgi:hypothetical protein